jgi:hypothetical protein
MGRPAPTGGSAEPARAQTRNRAPDRVLTGGVVAFNEEQHLEGALDSILSQPLPDGWRWGTVWVVASGCTDRTVEIAARFAAGDDRVRVVVETERRGKAHALAEVLRRAGGDALLLLNSDARAAPGAVAGLLRKAEGVSAPFAVMGRPVPAIGCSDAIGGMVRLLWNVHHEFHRELLADGGGTHLSDEMLLLSLPMAPPIPDGIINDGSYFGAWLAQHHGRRLYAPDAAVEIETPRTLRDHLRQRRRILVGHHQVARMVGIAPSALPRYGAAHPRAAVGIVRRAYREGRHRMRDLVLLAAGEMAATLLAQWDRVPPERDHVRWKRIEAPLVGGPERERARRTSPASVAHSLGTEDASAGPASFLDLRVETLLRVARRFGTGVPIDELHALLPSQGPAESGELRRWLERRPHLARVEGDRVFCPDDRPEGLAEREARARDYRRAAECLVGRHLAPVLPWVRCVGITGSTAYGAPAADDDLDLFVVTRTGSLWVFLAYTYLAVRIGFRPRPGTDRPPPCFNYVLEDRQAQEEFATARGFLFAREALTARIFRGEGYYRDLLAAAPWLGAEIPRLYGQRTSGVPPSPAPAAPWAIRVVNALVFPPLAAYLQLVGLRRNAMIREAPAVEGRFRTFTAPRRLAFVSDRFDQIRAELGPATWTAPENVGMASPSRIPTAR